MVHGASGTKLAGTRCSCKPDDALWGKCGKISEYIRSMDYKIRGATYARAYVPNVVTWSRKNEYKNNTINLLKIRDK